MNFYMRFTGGSVMWTACRIVFTENTKSTFKNRKKINYRKSRCRWRGQPGWAWERRRWPWSRCIAHQPSTRCASDCRCVWRRCNGCSPRRSGRYEQSCGGSVVRAQDCLPIRCGWGSSEAAAAWKRRRDIATPSVPCRKVATMMWEETWACRPDAQLATATLMPRTAANQN